MVTESQFTGRLLKELRLRLGPSAVILKHCDRYTSGVPDVSVTLNDHTLWLEIKVAPYKLTRLQTIMLKRMGGHCVTLVGRDQVEIDGRVYDFNGAVACIGMMACV